MRQYEVRSEGGDMTLPLGSPMMCQEPSVAESKMARTESGYPVTRSGEEPCMPWVDALPVLLHLEGKARALHDFHFSNSPAQRRTSKL